MPSITPALLERLRQQAGSRCGYCRTSSVITGQPLTVEHILPTARGGSSGESNLWLACRRCNEFKGSQVAALDAETDTVMPLFNPHIKAWVEHFRWSRDASQIVGLGRVRKGHSHSRMAAIVTIAK